jgi:hypothetical protein
MKEGCLIGGFRPWVAKECSYRQHRPSGRRLRDGYKEYQRRVTDEPGYGQSDEQGNAVDQLTWMTGLRPDDPNRAHLAAQYTGAALCEPVKFPHLGVENKEAEVTQDALCIEGNILLFYAWVQSVLPSTIDHNEVIPPYSSLELNWRDCTLRQTDTCNPGTCRTNLHPTYSRLSRYMIH